MKLWPEDNVTYCPMLMTVLSSASPHVTGIIDQVPSEELGRGLMLLSKVGFLVVIL